MNAFMSWDLRRPNCIAEIPYYPKIPCVIFGNTSAHVNRSLREIRAKKQHPPIPFELSLKPKGNADGF
jgi:hypothetical protein